MKQKRTIGLVLVAVMTASVLNFSYANEHPNTTTMELTDEVTTGSAIEPTGRDVAITGSAICDNYVEKSDNRSISLYAFKDTFEFSNKVNNMPIPKANGFISDKECNHYFHSRAIG